MLSEWDQIERNKTIKEMERKDAKRKQVIPLMWVFTYKFDNAGYLLKFKVRICVRGDL